MTVLKRTLALNLILLLSLGFLSGCAKGQSSDTEKSTIETTAENTKISVSVTLIQNDQELAQKTLELAPDSNLMEALQANFDITEEAGMIVAIDGLEQDPKKSFYWTYTINGEMVNTGAKDTPLASGDKVILTYAKF